MEIKSASLFRRASFFRRLAAQVLICSTTFTAQADTLFVTDNAGGNVFEYTSAGVQSTFASGLSGPTGLAFDKSGKLFVAQFLNGVIVKYSADGTSNTFATVSGAPEGLAFDTNGNLYAATAVGMIYKINTNGNVGTFGNNTGFSFGLAFDTNGNLFVASQGAQSIFKFDPTGTIRTVVASGLQNPRGLTFDAAGNLYVAMGTKIYQVVSGNLNQVADLGNSSEAFGIGFNSSGILFAADLNDGVIDVITNGVATQFGIGADEPFFLAFAASPLVSPLLHIQSAGANVVLTWAAASFALQSAPSVMGTYTNILGATSPFTNNAVAPQQFFRLKSGN